MSVKNDFYETFPLIFDENSPYFKGCNFIKGGNNFLVAKLHLRDTVFGFIMLVRTEPFCDEDADIADKICAVVSYAIKDSELSNVFKLQLKALQESILEKSRAFATIKKQNEKILEADKIKNDFLANISHELRTPLNAIIGFSEALSKKFFGELNEKQSEYVNDIHVSGIHLLGMINEILEISKIESKAVKLALSTFSLTMAITEVVNIVTPLANKKNIELKVDIPEDVEIKADYQKVQQILYNLLSNAIKFTKENGKIETGYRKKGDSVEIIGKPEYEPYVKECMRTTILEINSDGGCQAGMAPKGIDAAGLYGQSSRTDEKDGNTELSYAGCFPAENPRYAIGLFIDIQTKKGVSETNLAEQVNKLIEWLNSR